MRTTRILPAVTLVLVAILGASGCGYKLHVKTVLPPEPPATLQPGAAIHIQESANDVPSEVPTRDKIGRLLDARGYPTADASEAGLARFALVSADDMYFSFEIDLVSFYPGVAGIEDTVPSPGASGVKRGGSCLYFSNQ